MPGTKRLGFSSTSDHGLLLVVHQVLEMVDYSALLFVGKLALCCCKVLQKALDVKHGLYPSLIDAYGVLFFDLVGDLAVDLVLVIFREEVNDAAAIHLVDMV